MNTQVESTSVIELPTADDSQIQNPVLPPGLEAFLSVKTTGTPVQVTKPPHKNEVTPPSVVAGGDDAGDEGGDEDGVVDPLFRDLLGKPTKAEEKKVEVTDNQEGDVQLPTGELKGKEAEKAVRDAFAAQRKKLTSQIDTLKKQAAEKVSTVVPPEVTEKITRYEAENKYLKEQLSEQEKFVQIATLESSRVYRETIKAPIEGIKSDIIRISRENGGEDAGVSASEIYTAIQRGDRSAINTILTKLSETDKIELVSLTKEFRTIKAAEQSLRDNAKVASEEFDLGQEAQVKADLAERKAIYDKALGESRAEVEQAVKGLFTEVSGADDWNEVVREANTKFSKLSEIHPSQLSPKDVATLITDHVAGQLLKFKNDKLQAEVIRLANRLRQRRANTPGAGAGAGSTPQASVVKKNSSPPTAAEYLASKQGR